MTLHDRITIALFYTMFVFFIGVYFANQQRGDDGEKKKSAALLAITPEPFYACFRGDFYQRSACHDRVLMDNLQQIQHALASQARRINRCANK